MIAKSAASVPVNEKVIVEIASASAALTVVTVVTPSATLYGVSTVKTGLLSSASVTLTTIASVSEFVPSLATTFSE